MAKRELIERENLINQLTESSKHHAQTSREESLLYRDRQIVREQLVITEQEIVKPYLDKIRTEIEALEEGMTSYHNDRPWIFKDEALQIIDKYREESEG